MSGATATQPSGKVALTTAACGVGTPGVVTWIIPGDILTSVPSKLSKKTRGMSRDCRDVGIERRTGVPGAPQVGVGNDITGYAFGSVTRALVSVRARP